jgi:hypothetical protein
MYLKRIKLKNIFQFRGIHEIEFITPGPNKNGNVTLIMGKCGTGKTNICHAIQFCLFGNGGIRPDNLPIPNYNALEKAKKTDKPEVETYVEISFSHEGKQYLLKRSIMAIADNDNVKEISVNRYLVEQDENGAKKSAIQEDRITETISSIIDERLSFLLNVKGDDLGPRNFSANRIKHICESIADVVGSSVEEVRKELSDAMDYFWDDCVRCKYGEKQLSVGIRDDFELKVTNKDGKALLWTLAAGENIVLGAVFVLSVLNLLGASKYSEFPLIMDSPFGRLDLELRHGLRSTISQVARQVIILLSDGEMRGVEITSIKGIGYTGNIYNLIWNDWEGASIKKVKC